MMKKYKLGELCEVTRGMSLAGEYYAEEGDLIRLTLGNFDLSGGGFKKNTSKTDLFFTSPVKDEFILNKGDIITPLTEQTIGLLGATARIPESGKYIQSQDVALVRCKEGLLYPNYCYYLISSDIVRQQLSAGAQQTKIRHTTPDRIKDCIVWVPEYSEHVRIGDLLTTLDAKIALNKAINHNLEAMAKELYDYWFVQFDFPNAEGKPYKSSDGKMVWNDKLKREIPEGWECKTIANIATTNRNTMKPEAGVIYRHYSIPSFDSCGSYSEEDGDTIKSDKFILEHNDIVISKLNPWYNRVIWIGNLDNMIGSTEFVILRPKEADLGYLYSIIRTPEFIDYCSRTATGTSQSQRRVKPDVLMNFQFPYDEKITELFGLTIKHIHDIQTMNLEQITALMRQRDELLPLLMNGQVVVKD